MSVDKKKDNFSGAILSATGGAYEASESQREKLALIADGLGGGVLYVSRGHNTHPEVTSYRARLDRPGFKYKVEQVSLDEVRQMYADVIERAQTISKMQDYAKNLFRSAAHYRSSDIHIRVDEVKTSIFFGIHDELRLVKEEQPEFGKQLLTAIYGAMCDVSEATYESLSRQDARISSRDKLPKGLDGIRVATTPQVGGQVMVLRLLYDDATESREMEDLGFTRAQATNIRVASKRPTGINIITGPTGSGKSTTLQRQLSAMMLECNYRKNLITVEDPPEYKIVGAVQTPVQSGAKESSSEDERSTLFQDAIRAAMRLAPHIIMIGEVRDSPSASLAFRAAMTGHQVWTTLHTNGCFPTFARLLDLGIPPDLLYDESNVTSITSQRLVKRLCPHCRTQLAGPTARYGQEDIERVRRAVGSSDITLFVRGTGCERCGKTGTLGRKVISENVLCNEKLMDVMRRDGRQAGERYWRRQMNGKTMKEHAIEDIKAGIVDPFDAESKTGELTGLVLED